MKPRIKAWYRSFRREGKRVTAIICMLASAISLLAGFAPGSAMAAESENPIQDAQKQNGPALTNYSAGAAYGYSATNGLLFEAGNESAKAGLSEQDSLEEVVIISKQYTEIFYQTEQLPYRTTYIDCDYLSSGKMQTVLTGQDGTTEVEKAQVEGDTGSEAVTLAKNVISEPRDEIVLVGTGASAMAPYATPITADSIDPKSGVMTVSVGDETLQVLGAISCKASAYCSCSKCCGPYASGITSTGTVAQVGTVAVDPKVIPYGTKLFIVSDDGYYYYGYACAEDCGGAIKGNRIDLFFNSHSQALDFGRRTCTVYILAS